jgi:hypothetical protein
MAKALLVAVDVGSRCHEVAIGDSSGVRLDQFSVRHESHGFDEFFARIRGHQDSVETSVSIAMEGYNGWARPLDALVLERGWRLFNVNNLKLARYKEIFPAPGQDRRDRLPSDARVVCVSGTRACGA